MAYGSRKFSVVFTRIPQYSLTRAQSIKSLLLTPIYLRSILILSSHLSLGLPIGLFPAGLPVIIFEQSYLPFWVQVLPILFFYIYKFNLLLLIPYSQLVHILAVMYTFHYSYSIHCLIFIFNWYDLLT
jgi:hypothetical protein